MADRHLLDGQSVSRSSYVARVSPLDGGGFRWNVYSTAGHGKDGLSDTLPDALRDAAEALRTLPEHDEAS